MYLQLKVDLITNGPVVLVVLTIHHVIFNVTRDYIVNRLPTNDHTVACYVLNTLSNVLLISWMNLQARDMKTDLMKEECGDYTPRDFTM